MKTATKKAFREYLNAEYPSARHQNRQFKQITRLYGDYLYHQDREKFDVEFAEWVAKQKKD